MPKLKNVAGWCFCAAFLLGASGARADTTVERTIDTRASKAQFTVQHVFVEHVSGTVQIVSGSVTFRTGSDVPVGATAVLDANSVNTGESDRDGSLESPDFFDAHKFPTWTFVSTKVTPRGDGTFAMDGMLTVHGVTQPEHLDGTLLRGTAHAGFHAVAHIDRHAFGMTVTRLDPTIGGTVDVVLDLFLK